MSIYSILFSAIQSGDYTLTDMPGKVNTLYSGGCLTEEERDNLLTSAQENLDVEQERPELETTVALLADRVTALEESVAALESGGTSGTGGSTDSYPEWTTWDGVSSNYQQGAIVSHNGKLWISVYSGQNVWEPGVTGTENLWQEYSESEG
ncbi:MAG: hypothetical protein LIO45_06120 [Clostridiales bacterium]|nr:hypothetical protein [Clostridiales bacterium]